MDVGGNHFNWRIVCLLKILKSSDKPWVVCIFSSIEESGTVIGEFTTTSSILDETDVSLDIVVKGRATVIAAVGSMVTNSCRAMERCTLRQSLVTTAQSLYIVASISVVTKTCRN